MGKDKRGLAETWWARGGDTLWTSILPWTIVCLLSGTAAFAQLTRSDNQTWNQDDFELNSIEQWNHFGNAVAQCDFNGDGFDDLAIGAEDTDVFGVVTGAGSVYVTYGTAQGLSTVGSHVLVQPVLGVDPPEAFDQFGASLAAGDFNGDGWCDLAVGAGGEDVDGVLNAGSVHVFSGTAGGLLTTSQVWHDASAGLFNGGLIQFQRLGSSLAAGDFDGDSYDDLAIGGNGAIGFERIRVLYGSGAGLQALRDEILMQLNPGDSRTRFGFSMAVGRFNADSADDLAVGSPDWNINGLASAGRVHVFVGTAGGLDRIPPSWLDQALIPGQAPDAYEYLGWSLAAADFDGDGLDDLAFSAAGENVGLPGAEVESAGVVHVVLQSPSGFLHTQAQTWAQGSMGVSDQAEVDDAFGWALSVGDFDGDGFGDLAISVPFEDFEGGNRIDNGAVHALYGGSGGLASEREQYHGQGVWGVGGTESGDRFGEVLASGDFDGDGASDLVVGVPSEDLQGLSETGLVGVITGASRALFTDGFESGSTSSWN